MKAIESMSADELWTLYEEVSSVLAEKISTEKAKLEERLRKLETASHAINLDGVRRPYPKVLPKYQNPKNPAETWSGRGKQPRWVQAQLEAGERLEYLPFSRPRRPRFPVPVVQLTTRTADKRTPRGHRASAPGLL